MPEVHLGTRSLSSHKSLRSQSGRRKRIKTGELSEAYPGSAECKGHSGWEQ